MIMNKIKQFFCRHKYKHLKPYKPYEKPWMIRFMRICTKCGHKEHKDKEAYRSPLR